MEKSKYYLLGIYNIKFLAKFEYSICKNKCLGWIQTFGDFQIESDFFSENDVLTACSAKICIVVKQILQKLFILFVGLDNEEKQQDYWQYVTLYSTKCEFSLFQNGTARWNQKIAHTEKVYHIWEW